MKHFPDNCARKEQRRNSCISCFITLLTTPPPFKCTALSRVVEENKFVVVRSLSLARSLSLSRSVSVSAMLAVQGAVVGKLPAAAAQSRPFCPTRLSPTGNHMSPVCWRRRQKQPPRRLCAPPLFCLRFSLRCAAPRRTSGITAPAR